MGLQGETTLILLQAKALNKKRVVLDNHTTCVEIKHEVRFYDKIIFTDIFWILK
mgnify:CR=1 FL=1